MFKAMTAAAMALAVLAVSASPGTAQKDQKSPFVGNWQLANYQGKPEGTRNLAVGSTLVDANNMTIQATYQGTGAANGGNISLTGKATKQGNTWYGVMTGVLPANSAWSLTFYTNDFNVIYVVEVVTFNNAGVYSHSVNSTSYPKTNPVFRFEKVKK